MFKNRNLLIIALIAVVNALGYGIIIPILYSYSIRYGLNDFQNGLLFSIFSICQFIATPFLGRFSDTWGRKPVLIISLAGTAISFIMMAFAPNAIFLFLARALDGLTAGNLPVASAVISDTTEPKDRARGFGIIGASFGFGFTFGPAISGLTLGWGLHVPFLIAAVITIVAVVLTMAILPETNKNPGIKSHHGKIFDFKRLVKALFDADVGITLLISLIYSFAFGLMIYAFQPVAIKVVGMNAQQVSLNFTVFGVMGIVAQMFVIPWFVKNFGDKKSLTIALIVSTAAFLAFFLAKSFIIMLFISVFLALSNSLVNPLIQTLLSKETTPQSQGEILGVNSSYVGLGMIFGPIVGGIAASISLPAPFLLGAFAVLCCFVLSFSILRQPHKVAL